MDTGGKVFFHELLYLNLSLQVFFFIHFSAMKRLFMFVLIEELNL